MSAAKVIIGVLVNDITTP